MADAGSQATTTTITSGIGNTTAVAALTGSNAGATSTSSNEAALNGLMERIGYPMVQENGQRKLGPPSDLSDQPAPPRGSEVFVGKIPRDCFEDELFPVFERIGRIYEIRMMMDFNGSNRGYCFVAYTNRTDAKRAVKELNDYEIRERRFLGVCLSVDNCRLFVGGIPLDKQRDEIVDEMRKVTEGVVDAIVYPSVADKTKNRGFTFVEFDSHRSAAMARRKLLPGRIQLWGQPIAVDWAEPELEVDEDVMSKVKILYVRNLMLSTTEQTIETVFNEAATKEAGAVERVKKLKDYAFVHFRERGDALRAMNALNGTVLDGSTIEVVLAKPVSKENVSNLHPVSNKPNAMVSYPGIMSPHHQYVAGSEMYTSVPNGLVPQNVGNFRGFAGHRGMPVSPRGSFSARGRGAAGSRGAGGIGRTYAQRNSYRSSNSESQRSYEIHPGMELIPVHPMTLKPVQHKPPTQILEEYCQKNGWESPVYQLYSTVGRDNAGDGQFFVYKVIIPPLPQSSYMPNKLSRSVDEAKKIAAENVLLHIGIPVEGVYQFPYPPPLAAGFHGY